MSTELCKEESLSLDVDEAEGNVVNMDRNSRESIDEDRSSVISNLDEAISLRTVRSTIPTGETNVRRNLRTETKDRLIDRLDRDEP